MEGLMRFNGSRWNVLAVLVGATKAHDRAAARSHVNEAIAEQGREARPAKWPLVAANTMGTFHGYERTPVFFFKSGITNHGADRWRHVLDGELKGQKFRVANVLDGKRGWIKMEGNGKEETREFTPA